MTVSALPPAPLPLLPKPNFDKTEEILFPFSVAASGLGLQIIGGRGESDHPSLPPTPIYIRRLLPDGAAARDGRLRRGDILLGVNHAKFGDVTADFARDALKAACSVAASAVAGGQRGDEEGQVRLMVQRRSPETDHVFQSILAMREDGASTSLGGGASTISSRADPSSPTSLPPFVGVEEELRDTGDWSFLSGSEDLPPPPPIPRGLNYTLSEKSHRSQSSHRIRDTQRGEGQSRKREDENRDGAILNGDREGGAVFGATRSRRAAERTNEETRKLNSDQKRDDSSASRPFSFRSNRQTSSAADQFSFSPLGAPTHRQNPLYHDSRTGIDVNSPYHHHPRSSSTIDRPLGLIPFAKIVPSLRRLGFDISKSSAETLVAELDAIDGFAAKDRSLVDAEKCFEAAKRVFRGKTATKSREDAGKKTKSGAERRRSESFTGLEESTAALSKHIISDEKRFNSLKESNSSRQRRNFDDLTDVVPCASSSPSSDVRAMSKLLSECRDERDAARIDVAKWMLRTEELESFVHKLSKEAKDARILGADAVAENKELKKRLKDALGEVDELKTRDSSNSDRIQTLTKRASEAESTLEARKEHPEVAKKLAVLTCELKKWKRWSNVQDVASHRMLSFLEKTHSELMRKKEEGAVKNVLIAENGDPPNYLASLTSSAPSFQTVASKCRQLYLSVKSLLEDEEPLPFGWERTLAPNKSASYFVNHVHGKSSWTHPLTGESTFFPGGDNERTNSAGYNADIPFEQEDGDGDDGDPSISEMNGNVDLDILDGGFSNRDDGPRYEGFGDGDRAADDAEFSRAISDRSFNEVSLL